MSPYHHEDLEGQIKDACLAHIREQGELNLSIRALSAELGVSHNALYHYYRSKKELEAELVRVGFALLGEALEEPADEEVATIEEFGLRYFRFFRQEPQLYRFMFKNVPQSREKGGSPTFAKLLARVGEDTFAAYHHWALIHGVCTLLSDGAFGEVSLDDPDIEDKVLAILSHGSSR